MTKNWKCASIAPPAKCTKSDAPSTRPSEVLADLTLRLRCPIMAIAAAGNSTAHCHAADVGE